MHPSNKPRKECETPEGGWGYFVCLGMIMIFVFVHGVTHCFGLVFNDFLKETGAGTGIFPVLNSCTYGAISVAGLFFHSLTHKFSKRVVGLIGATFYCIGGFFQLFATSIAPLFVAFILNGASLGLMMPAILSTFNSYFMKHRVMMMSITQAIIGLGQMAVPIVVQYFLENFGFRGCLLILAGLNFHCIIAMLLMHPVEWHAKKRFVEEECLSKDSPAPKDEESQPLKPLTTNMENITRRILPSAREERAPSNEHFTALKEPSKPFGIWERIIEFLDLTLLKQPVYVNIVLGVTISFYSDLSFFVFQPLYLLELDYSKADAAQIMAIGSGADLVSRCILAVASAMCTIHPRYTFLAGVVLSLIARYVFIYAIDFWSVAILTAIIGFFKTWIHVPMPLVFADYLSKERFPSGYGLFLFLKGMISFGIGPVVRYIRDAANSYIVVFQFLNVLLATVGISWFAEIVWKKCKGRRKHDDKSLENEEMSA